VEAGALPPDAVFSIRLHSRPRVGASIPTLAISLLFQVTYILLVVLIEPFQNEKSELVQNCQCLRQLLQRNLVKPDQAEKYWNIRPAVQTSVVAISA
jgi:hypothetical protein